MASIIGTLRPGKGRGASAPEVKAAAAVPDQSFSLTDADMVVEELVNADKGMSALEVLPGQGNNRPARYFLSTRLTHRMLVNSIRRSIADHERDEVILEFARRLASNGPFRELRFVEANKDVPPAQVLATAGIDIAYTTRLIVLDPVQFSLRNGVEETTLHALSVGMGLDNSPEQYPVQWASSAVFAVANTQRRGLARATALEYLALDRALDASEIQADETLKAAAQKELAVAKQQLEKAVRRIFRHVVYLAQPDPDGSRFVDQFTFEDDSYSSLDGTLVWKTLAEREKVFDKAQFDARALLHNLRESDYGRTLSDLRAAFFSAPRLPLLYGGDKDLQQALYDAVQQGLLRIVDGTGTDVAVLGPGQVNLASSGLRVARIPAPESGSRGEDEVGDPSSGSGTSTGVNGGDTAGTAGGEEGGEAEPTSPSTGSATGKETNSSDQQLSFSLSLNLLSSEEKADQVSSLFRALYLALDEREISYVQGTFQLVVHGQGQGAERIVEALDDLGVAKKLRDL